jgi:protease-4
MPDYHGPEPLDALPVERPRPRRPAGSGSGCFLGIFLIGSLILNAILFCLLFVSWGSSGIFHESDGAIRERHYSGSTSSSHKIAVIQISGVLVEGLTSFANKEIDRAAADDSVKAVVLRVNSPGGTITASDDLYRRLVELRDGNPEKKRGAKPLVVSMATLAASGGYYIAMPAKTLMAERSTITGSIGVYASLPNVTKLGDKIGFSMNIIRAGDVKDSGSAFHEMTDHERELWQAMVDHSYLQFLHVVEEGRPKLKGKLQEDIVIDQTVPIRDQAKREKKVHYTRYRADGGIFMADEAKKYGLIDEIGTLEDAIKLARGDAKLDADTQAVLYERPPSLFGSLLGGADEDVDSRLDWKKLSQGLTPRLWYLSSQSELAGLMAAGRE